IFTQNPAEMQGGRRAHSPALENKFRKIYLRDDFTPEELTRIVAETMPRLASIASNMVEAHAEALKTLANDNETLTLRDLQRWGLIATALIETKTLSPEESIMLGAELVYPGRTLNLEVRDELERVLGKFYQGIHQSDLSFLNESHPELRAAIRRALARPETADLASVYRELASSQGLPLDLWLGRLFQEASAEDLSRLFQELGWDVDAQCLWMEKSKVRNGRAILEQALTNQDSNVRETAARILVKFGDPSSRPALEQALKDKVVFVRQFAVQALGQLGDSAALPALKQALKDEDPYVRFSAASILGQLGNTAVRPSLEQALTGEDDFGRCKAAEALGKLGDKAARPALEQALKDKYEGVRASAAKALGQLGDPAARPALEQALNDEESQVRAEAAKALGNLGDKAARPVLEQALNDESSIVRISALEALSKFGNTAARTALEQAFNGDDRNFFGRSDAAEALGNLGDKAARPILEQALKDKYAYVRASAAKALGQLGDPAARSALEQALKDPESKVAWSAADALDRLAPGWSPQLPTLADLQKVISEELHRELSTVQSDKAEGLKKLLAQLPEWGAAEAKDPQAALRSAMRRALAKPETADLASVYQVLAASQGLPLDLWLAKAFYEASTEDLSRLFQE
ncbi:MAG TPA: HEAT repeat domain-containing protein, partial [bacterium]|nr:HEAT repeat domain-containing protein [bacterium]